VPIRPREQDFDILEVVRRMLMSDVLSEPILGICLEADRLGCLGTQEPDAYGVQSRGLL
jgi:hypothetical protein